MKITWRLRLLVAGAAGDRHVLAADAAEERGQAPVVVLAPLLVRVVVALGAGEPQAEEHLGGVVHELLGLLQLLVPDRRRALASRRRSPPRMSRTNSSYGLSSAIASRIQAWNANVPVARSGWLRALHAQDVGPLVGEVVGVLRRLEQPVDQLVALLRVLVGDEVVHLLRRRQRAGEVEVHAADELLVACTGRDGTRPSSFHFFARVLVDDGLGSGTASPGVLTPSGTVARKTATCPW